MGKKKEIQPYWRPNVRVNSTLPDIKVVRTDFIVNFIAIALLVITGAYLLQREYKTFSLGSEVSRLEEQIKDSEGGDAVSLGFNKRFVAAAAHVQELQSFYNAPIKPYELIAELTASKPEKMLFTNISLRENVDARGKKMSFVVDIKCEVPELTILSSYKSILLDLAILNSEDFSLGVEEKVPPARNIDRGVFPCGIVITIGPASKGGKG